MMRLTVCCLVLLLAGCGAPHRQGKPLGTSTASGMVHRVSRGETLWSISRRYGVELDSLVRTNQISDASRIQVGQRLRIPADGKDSGARPAIRKPVIATRTSIPQDDGRFVWPVRGRIISIFGVRREGIVNKGLDIEARSGTEVLAARSGQVSFVHEGMPGFGKTIIIDHGDGFASVYAYIGKILVSPGENVNRRQVIARVGSTGRTQTPALHFEIRRHQKPNNPLHYLP